jgi:peptidoglycan hydrolase CwlO-like protein
MTEKMSRSKMYREYSKVWNEYEKLQHEVLILDSRIDFLKSKEQNQENEKLLTSLRSELTEKEQTMEILTCKIESLNKIRLSFMKPKVC